MFADPRGSVVTSAKFVVSNSLFMPSIADSANAAWPAVDSTAEPADPLSIAMIRGRLRAMDACIRSVLLGALLANLLLACASNGDGPGGGMSGSSSGPGGGGASSGGSSSNSAGTTNGGSGGGTDELYGWTQDSNSILSYDIQALWGSGSSDIWAATGGGDVLGGEGQIHHDDGKTWELVYTMGTPGLLDVWGVPGGSDVFFVGHGPQFYQLTSTDVTLLESLESGSLVENTAVWASAPDAVWVGSASISEPLRFWNGEEFVTSNARYRSPNQSGVEALWGSSATDVWAADQSGIVHFDGQGWTQSYASTGADLLSISGSGPNDVWAVGPRTLIHFNGEKWEEQPDGKNKALNAVWAAGPNDVWLVGDNGRVLHGSTSGLKTVASGITKSLFAIWGVGTHDIWAGGADGTRIHYGPVEMPTTDPDKPACSPQGAGCSMTPCCSPFRCTNIGGGILACG